MRLRNGAYEENSQPVERTCVCVCYACVTCLRVLHVRGCHHSFSLSLPRKPRVHAILREKGICELHYVQEWVIDEIARISSGGTI